MAKKKEAAAKAKKTVSKKEKNPKVKAEKKEVQKRDNIKSLTHIAEKMHENYQDISKNDILEFVKDVFKNVKETIMESKEGESLSIHGFGSFRAITKNPRKARNPKTGETIDVPAKRAVKFRPTTMFKTELNATFKPKKETKSTSKKKSKKTK